MSLVDPIWVTRILACYSKSDESLVAEYDLEWVSLGEMQKLWHQPESEPMFGCFAVMPTHRNFIEKHTNIQFNFEAYEYFIEAICTDDKAMRLDGGFLGQYAAPRELQAFPDAKRVLPKTSLNSK